ncbi:MAG: hypothetical protein M3252_06970 [Actinomycetota bacterium]|nr:hypothetical protein [Actinomycetota bacterium]
MATGFVFGLALSPPATRLVASIFVTSATSDVLQFAYARVQQIA